MKHDLLHIQGKPFVLVPLHEYRTLSIDVPAPANADLPHDVLDALTAGQESPIKILRKYRAMTQQDLAEAASLSRPYLTEIEKGRKDGSLRAIKAIADALKIDIRYLMAS